MFVPFGQAVGRWGNFVNQEAFGKNTTLPWGMTGNIISSELSHLKLLDSSLDPNGLVHPTFLYESIWNIGVLIVLLRFRSNKNRLTGEVFFLYMILYSIGRFFIEPLRIDSLMFFEFRISQVLALAFVCMFSIILLVRRRFAHQ